MPENLATQPPEKYLKMKISWRSILVLLIEGTHQYCQIDSDEYVEGCAEPKSPVDKVNNSG